MNNQYACGVDIGGSHITAALIDCTSYHVVTNTIIRERIDSKASATQIIGDWAAALQPLLNDQMRLGIAMPGPFDYEEGVSLMKGQDKYDALYRLNVKALLSEVLHIEKKSIHLSNDASCFLKGEVAGGVLKGVQHAIGITLGTGLGTAVFHAPDARDANLWNSPFRDSIAEDYLSARWCTARYRELTGNLAKDVQELAVLVASGDILAQQVFHEFGENLGVFLVDFITVESAEGVVLGGNVAKAMPLFMPAVERVLTAAGITLPVQQSVLGENAALVGAVYQ